MMKLSVHPQSLLSTMARGQWAYPLINLFWLLYVVVAGLFFPMSLAAQVFTWASLLVFLPLYALAWLDDTARLPRYVAAIVVLGLLSVPINTVFSYIVYAASFLMYWGSRRGSFVRLGLLMAAFIGVAALNPRFTPAMIAFAVALCLVIAIMGLTVRRGAERDAAMRLTHDELRRLAASAERERIGRDLHDTLGATLALIAVKSELAGRLLDRNSPNDKSSREQVADIEAVAREALAQVRAAVAGIRSAVLAGEAASARLLLETAGVAFSADIDPLPLSAEAESALALGLREAATNALKHARAQAVRVTLRAEGDEAVMTMQDDGQGAAIKRGHGLRGMEERMAALGGSVEIASVLKGSERGTRLTLRVPMPRTQQAEASAPAPRFVPGASAA